MALSNQDQNPTARRDPVPYFIDVPAHANVDSTVGVTGAVLLPEPAPELESNQINAATTHEDTNILTTSHQIMMAFDPTTGQPMIPREAPIWMNQGGDGGGKPKKRCAVCVWNYCLRRHDCPGNGGRTCCGCDHSRRPPKRKIRISDDMIDAFDVAHPGLTQQEREGVLVAMKGM